MKIKYFELTYMDEFREVTTRHKGYKDLNYWINKLIENNINEYKLKYLFEL